MTPPLDPRTEAQRLLAVPFGSQTQWEAEALVVIERLIAALAALESERDEAKRQVVTLRAKLAESRRMYGIRRELQEAAEARVAQLEELLKRLVAWEESELSDPTYLRENIIPAIRSALGVVANGGGGRDE